MSSIIQPSTQALQLLTASQASAYKVVPKNITGNVLVCYSFILDVNNQEELEIITGQQINVELIPESDFNLLLAKSYRSDAHQKSESRAFDGDASLFVKDLIGEAKNFGSSDIHLEVYENECRVRIRIDGKLIERYILDKKDYPSIINKIKILANLDISEKRLPQDGRMFFKEFQQKFDIRVSVLPTLHGEKCVMRILGNDADEIELEKLGFTEKELSDFKEGIKKPHGLLLVSGPTGSGKTTTLYATLKELNKSTTNITTIEDPIEYTLKGINQVQLRSDIGLDFASALRTFLRQDPDVIMVGEIRDSETANMAIRASLTGHLVLSTIHTNSAWGIITRLIDMGIPAYLIAGTLNTAIAQRLVRKLCENCKKSIPLDSKDLPLHFTPPYSIQSYFEPFGCEICHFTGYKGRKAIYEVINLDTELIHAIRENRFIVNDLLEARNIKTLSNNAYDLLSNGTTSLEEVYPILMNNN